jgi:hypothetical protein
MRKTRTNNDAAREAGLRDRLRHATFAYLDEATARHVARSEFADYNIIIVHSRHDLNPKLYIKGKTFRLDYWIDEPGLVRSWETVLFDGQGKDA